MPSTDRLILSIVFRLRVEGNQKILYIFLVDILHMVDDLQLMQWLHQGKKVQNKNLEQKSLFGALFHLRVGEYFHAAK